MVGYKVRNKTGVRMATSESENVSEVRNNPKITVDQLYDFGDKHHYFSKTSSISRPLDASINSLSKLFLSIIFNNLQNFRWNVSADPPQDQITLSLAACIGE